MQKVFDKIDPRATSWISLFFITLASAYLYVLLEWLFIITKPSFLSSIALVKKVEIFFFSGSLLAALACAGVLVLFGISKLSASKKFQQVCLGMAVFIPAVVLAVLALLLVDNFTYTVFYFGIATSEGLFRGLYALGFLLAIAWLYVRILGLFPWLNGLLGKQRRPGLLIPMAVVVLAVLLVLTYRPNTAAGQLAEASASTSAAKLPNIILITADGVNASHTSLYGYERNTTPRLRKLASSSLLAENAFPNAGNTAGSIISIYTSKSAVRTGVLFPPNILKGQDSYQHLPGILKANGYYTLQYTTEHYADANDLNLLSGFDVVNGNPTLQSGVLYQFQTYLQTDHAYFLYEMANRITDRLRHIFFLRRMTNNQALVQAKTQKFDDPAKFKKVLDAIESSDQPVFAHVHWMGTHGRTHTPRNQVFSLGKKIEEQKNLDPDFYDDSILEFDTAVGQLIDDLASKGYLDDTILIIGSDHGQSNVTNARIPLLFYFPQGGHVGIIQGNAQNLDIAPTILDGLGMDVPAWMEGQSLLRGEPGRRPIISVGIGLVDVEGHAVVEEKLEAPFYQFGSIQVIDCDRWYRLDLRGMEWLHGGIEGYSGVCDPAQVAGDETVLGWMRASLNSGGFDTSTINDFSAISKK